MNDRHRMDDLLSRHRLGELPDSFREEVQRFLSTPEGRRRMEQLEAEDERILQDLPPRRVAEAILRRVDALERREPNRRHRTAVGWLAGSGLAVALGGLAVVASLRFSGPTPVAQTASASPEAKTDSVAQPAAIPTERPSSPVRSRLPEATVAVGPTTTALAGEDGLRTKGEVRRLRVHRVVAPTGVAVSLADGDTAHAGDLLQVSILSGPTTFAAVLSVDGRGQVTRHLPETGDSSISLREGREAPHSFQLDATAGFERFVLIQSPQPFLLGDAEALLRRAGARSALAAPFGWSVQSILVAKPEQRP
jgi:hypothetical protein